MEDRETIVKLARSEMAREAVEKRWAQLNPEERREAVKAANEGRRRHAARRREWLKGHARRVEIANQLGEVLGRA